MVKKEKVLDDIDKEIIRILQDDARKSYREIQEQLQISIGTIHNRITKLKKNKIIEGYTLKLNNIKLGYKLTFLISLQIDGKYTEEILSELSEKPEICTVFNVTGEQSATIICRFKESEDVHEFLRELNEHKHVIRTNSNMVLKEYKNNAYIQL